MAVSTSSARLFHPHSQQRALIACVGVSIALHATAMLAFPGLRPGAPSAPKILTATLTSPAAPQPAETRPEPARPAPRPRPAVKPDPRPEITRPAPSPVPHAEPPSAAVSEQTASAAPEAPAAAPGPAPSAAASEAQAQIAEPLDPALLHRYRVGLASFAQQFKRYPAQAIERGWEGRVEIRITVRPTGAIESARIKTPSGHQILDDQALDMVKRALARTPFPPALLGREFSIDIPVIFELQSG